MADTFQLTAYNVKTKQKNVPILDGVITRTSRGAYMVKGHDEKGFPLTTLCNEEKARKAVQLGLATTEIKDLLEEPASDENVHARTERDLSDNDADQELKAGSPYKKSENKDEE